MMKWRVPLLCVGVVCLPAYASGANDPQLRARPSEVPQYEKIEFDVTVDTQYDHPFDVRDVDLRIVLRTPRGAEVRVPAFYLQPYERRDVERSGRPAACSNSPTASRSFPSARIWHSSATAST